MLELQKVTEDQLRRLYDAGFPRNIADVYIPLSLKWMMEVKGKHGNVYISRTQRNIGWRWEVFEVETADFINCSEKLDLCDTYEAAESVLLDELLKIIENGKE